jgi:DNA recombination protein RmuC
VSSYHEAVNAANEADSNAKMGELAAAVRAHFGGFQSAGKELTVAFLPGDVLLGAALEQDPGLLEFAAQRGVVVATPNSLVGLLGAASSTWRHHELSEELKEARAQNQKLFSQLALFSGSLEGLRGSLGMALSSYTPGGEPGSSAPIDAASQNGDSLSHVIVPPVNTRRTPDPTGGQAPAPNLMMDL